MLNMLSSWNKVIIISSSRRNKMPFDQLTCLTFLVTRALRTSSVSTIVQKSDVLFYHLTRWKMQLAALIVCARVVVSYFSTLPLGTRDCLLGGKPNHGHRWSQVSWQYWHPMFIYIFTDTVAWRFTEYDVARGQLKFQCNTWDIRAMSCSVNSQTII